MFTLADNVVLVEMIPKMVKAGCMLAYVMNCYATGLLVDGE